MENAEMIMGNLVAKLRATFQKIFDLNRRVRILVLGLDAAGKTTFLYKLHVGETVQTIPTLGFNVETVEYKNLEMNMWDVGGQTLIRRLWKHYYQGTDALIYLVDSADPERFPEAAEELNSIMEDDSMRNVHLLVLCNKQDLPNAVTPSTVMKELHLESMRGRKWWCQGCSATSGDGIFEGMDWLATSLKEKIQQSTG